MLVNRIQLRDVDLNLLVVLEVLLRERSVTRAARHLQNCVYRAAALPRSHRDSFALLELPL